MGMVARFQFWRSDAFQAALAYVLLLIVFPAARMPSFYAGIGLLFLPLLLVLWLASFKISIVVVYRLFEMGFWIAESCSRFFRCKQF